jgi:NDP-sugar pyrophosphorylase family protein
MVLAAGRGTRMRPLTDTVPKPLIPVAGRPMIEHILEFLRRGGIEEVVINLHHLGHLIEQHVGHGERFGVRVRYSPEDPILDTGGGIKRAESLLAGEPFVVANGDSLLDLRLEELLAFHRRRGGMATLAVRPDADAARYGLVEVDAGDRLRRIAGLPAGPIEEPLRGFMFPGLHVLEPSIFSWMEAGRAFSITRDTYPRLIAGGIPVYGYETASRWVNIDTPAALAAADDTLRRAPFHFGSGD